MKKQKIVTTTIIALCSLTTSADVPNSFTAGTTILSSEMNENFNQLDGRVTTLETGSTNHDSRINTLESNQLSVDQRVTAIETGTTAEIFIDCTGDANSFINTVLEPNTTYTLTGMCNGPIEITKGNITIQGDSVGTKDDGIILPTGLTTNPYAALGIYGGLRVDLNNLTVSAVNYTDNTSWSVAASYMGYGARVEITETDFLGGRYGVVAFTNSLIRFFDDVSVSGFGRTGIDSTRNSVVDARASITVSGNLSSVETKSYGLSASHGGHIKIRQGGSITAPNGSNIDDPTQNRRAIQAASTGSVNGQIGSNVTFDVIGGRVFAYGSSNIELYGANISGLVKSRGSSNIKLSNSIVQQQVRSEQSSSVELDGTTVSLRLRVQEAASAYVYNATTISGGLDVVESSSVEVDSSNVSGNLEINHGSNVIFYNSTISGGYQHAYRGGNIDYYNSDITLTSGQNIWANDGGHIAINGTSTVTTVDSMYAGANSSLYLNGGDLGGAVIECINEFRAYQISENGATNYSFHANCN